MILPGFFYFCICNPLILNVGVIKLNSLAFYSVNIKLITFGALWFIYGIIYSSLIVQLERVNTTDSELS